MYRSCGLPPPFTKRPSGPSPRWTCANPFLTFGPRSCYTILSSPVPTTIPFGSPLCESVGIFTCGQLLNEVALRDSGRPHRSPLTNLFDKLAPPDVTIRQDYFFDTFQGAVNPSPRASGSCMPPCSDPITAIIIPPPSGFSAYRPRWKIGHGVGDCP